MDKEVKKEEASCNHFDAVAAAKEAQKEQWRMKPFIDEAKRIEEDALYSGKGHYNACKMWEQVGLVLGSLYAADTLRS